MISHAVRKGCVLCGGVNSFWKFMSALEGFPAPERLPRAEMKHISRTGIALQTQMYQLRKSPTWERINNCYWQMLWPCSVVQQRRIIVKQLSIPDTGVVLWRRNQCPASFPGRVECARITSQLICVLLKKLWKEISAEYEKCKGRAFSPDTGMGSLVTKVI